EQLRAVRADAERGGEVRLARGPVVAARPELSPGGGVVGDGRIVVARRPRALPGHEHPRAVRADGDVRGEVAAPGRGPVVATQPQLRAGGDVVGDGRVIG